jgi:hypothetical protein
VSSNKYWLAPNDGTYRFNIGEAAPRAVAWCHRQLAGLCTIYPDRDPTGLKDQYIRWLAWSVQRYANIFARGTEPYPFYAGPAFYNNNLGIVPWSEPIPDTRPWMQDFIASIYAWSCDLEIPGFSTSEYSNLRAVRDFLFKGPVGRLGGAGPDQYNYTRAARYGAGAEPCSYTKPGATNRLLEDLNSNYGEVYTASGYGPNTNGEEGQALEGSYIDQPAFALSYWVYLFEAVTLAVDAGYPGAASARRRLVTASNWARNEPRFGDNPEHGRTPR